MEGAHRPTSRYGADVYWDGNGPRFYVGVVGLYPALWLWGLVWLIARRKRHVASHFPTCGYDLRASPGRCPECGEVREKSPHNPPPERNAAAVYLILSLLSGVARACRGRSRPRVMRHGG